MFINKLSQPILEGVAGRAQPEILFAINWLILPFWELHVLDFTVPKWGTRDSAEKKSLLL